jgi:hypothetical protein
MNAAVFSHRVCRMVNHLSFGMKIFAPVVRHAGRRDPHPGTSRNMLDLDI